MEDELSALKITHRHESLDVFGGALRFLKSIRVRLPVMIAFVTLSTLAGGIYYVVAPRVYGSHAELLVLQTGNKALDAESGQSQSLSDVMPTFERVMSRDKVIKRTIRAIPPEHRIDLQGVSPDAWIDAFRSRLSVSTARNTNIITVSYRSRSAETAFVVVGELVNAFLEFMDGVHQNNARELLQLLTREKTQVEEDIRQKEAEHLQLLDRTPVVFGSDERPTNVLNERVISLNTELVEAQKRRLVAHARLLSISEALRQGEDVQQFAMEMAESLGTELLRRQFGVGQSDGYTAAHIEEELVKERTELKSKRDHYGDKHPEIRRLTDSIRSKEQWLIDRPEAVRQSVDQLSANELGPRMMQIAQHQYQSSLANEEKLREEYERESRRAQGFNTQLAELRIAELDLERMRQYHLDLMGRIANLDLNKENGLRTTVLTDAQIYPAAVAPRLSFTLIACLILGVSAGCATIYMLDLIDDRFHSADDLRTQVGAPVLASVRKLEPVGSSGLESLHTFRRPNSVESEAFRTLRTSLDFTNGGVRRLAISSTEPGDGKTTVMANLAVAYAQSGKKTLVIDGDMRRPGMTKLFDRSGQAGLSTVLKDDRPIAQAVEGLLHHTEHPLLHVLSAGPRPVNPVELLTSDRLPELLAWADTVYDQVLVDVPPSLAVADAPVIGRMLDGVVLAVRPDKNRRKLVLRAAEALTSVGCELLGLVVNHVTADRGDEYGYGYGYGDYGHDEPLETDASAPGDVQASVPFSPFRRPESGQQDRAA